jgi:hypothetical protein
VRRHFVITQDDGTVREVHLPEGGAIVDIEGRLIFNASTRRVDVVGDPPTQAPQPPAGSYADIEIDNSVYGFDNGEKVRVGPERKFKSRVFVPDRPAPKKKAKAS